MRLISFFLLEEKDFYVVVAGSFLYSFLNDDAKVARPYILAIYLCCIDFLSQLGKRSPALIIRISLAFGHLLIFPFPQLGFCAPSVI